MSDLCSPWNDIRSSHESLSSMDKLPQPVGGEGRFRADAPAFVPGGVSAIFLSSTSDAFQTTSPEKRTCVSPFYSLQSSTFMPPETPSIPTTPRFAAPPYISLAPSTPKTFSYTGTSETINAKSSTNLSTAQVHARTISDVVSSGKPHVYENPRPRSRSDAPRSARVNGQIRLSLPKDYASFDASSNGSLINHSELAAPSPQRRVLPQLLVNHESRSTSRVNDAAYSENSDIVGNLLQFTNTESLATSPQRMLFPARSQPHSRTQSQKVSPLLHAQNKPSYGYDDRGGTPGGVMFPRGISGNERTPRASQLQEVYSLSPNPKVGLRARNGSLDSISEGVNRLLVETFSPENKQSRATVIDQTHMSRLSLNSNTFHGKSDFWTTPYGGTSNVSSPESHVSSESFGTQLDGQSASHAGISPDRMRAKLLAQAIRDGRAEESSRNGHAQYNQQERQSSIPSTPHPGRMNLTSVGGLNYAEVMPATIPLDPLVQKWRSKGGPTLSEAFDNLPFTERCRITGPVNWGVIKIMDIPYGTTRPEVVALLGRNARLVQQPSGTSYFAIHIIMERTTAKSMDCYVELETIEDALLAASRFETYSMRSGKRPRIGDRQVIVEHSSQEALMAELFPRAKCVKWQGQQAVIEAPKESYSSGFQGFVTSEEMVMTVKYAENPSRSRFAIKHLQRTYESVISLLAKYPWWMINNYTLGERDTIFKATRDSVRALADQLARNVAQPPLTLQLLQELVHAGLQAPGFSENQRAQIIDAAGGLVGIPVYVTPIASVWPFEVLQRKDDVNEELVQYIICLLIEASTQRSQISLADRFAASVQTSARNSTSPFGDVKIAWPVNKASMTMAEAGRLEWDTVQALLAKVLT